MPDALDRLRARYTTRPAGRELCPACGQRENQARVVVQVRRIQPEPGKKTGPTVVSAVRSVCNECAASIFDGIYANELPTEAGNGQRGGRPREP
jgi:hypothetical protein